MPQSDDVTRARIEELFHDGVSDAGPIKYLTDAGYTLSKDWTWSKPGVTHLWQMTPEEQVCMQFLFEEWDFGGLE
jgi:hypothetical protein